MVSLRSHSAARVLLGLTLVAGNVTAATHFTANAASAHSIAKTTVHATSQTALIVASSPLSLSSASVVSGGQVTAQVTLQNQGTAGTTLRGLAIAARTPSGGNADFGTVWNISLAPGQSVTVQKSRSFSASDPAGAWTLFASYQSADGIWHPLAPTLSLTVGAPVAVSTELVPSTPLTLSTSTVSPGGQVAASVTLKNQTAASISLGAVVLAARTPSGGNADFGGAWGASTLAPGQSITVQKTRSFSAADPVGTWTLFVSYETSDGVWHPLAPNQPLTVGALATQPIATSTATAIPPTATSTATAVPPTATSTKAPPTATSTAVPPTATSTATAVPPTATATKVPPTATSTQVPPTATATTVPSSGSIILGATIKDNGSSVYSGSGLLEWYAGLVGKMPAIVNAGGGQSITIPFDPGLGDYVMSKGSMLMWTMMTKGTNAEVASGTYDSSLRTFAQSVKTWGHPLYLRLNHEANGNWYPYGTQGSRSGDSASDYVAMWKHVHDIFTSAGATNVRWIWCVNIDYSGATPYTQMYPGDGYVDWVALDGYDKSGTQSLQSVFQNSYNQLTKLTSKPLMIAETGALEQSNGSYKSNWITQGLLTTIPQVFPRVRAVLWFDWSFSDGDWRVNTSSNSLAAWKTVTASSLYQGKAS